MTVDRDNLMRGVALAGMLLLAACGGDGAVDSGPAPDATGAAATAAAAVDSSAAAGPAPASEEVAIIAQAFAYGATEERNFVGYFAAPEEIIEPLPGIVLVHERWGLDESVRSLARDLARAGYAVMAVDLFDGGTAVDSASAQALVEVAAADREGLLGNIGQAIDYLRAYALAPRVAVVGYGFGGGLALDSAVGFPEKLDAVASFYGRLIFDETVLARLRAPLLGIYAEHDESVPVQDVQSFRRLLRDQGNNAEVLIFPGSQHGFADPGRPTYEPAAADEAWQELTDFLAAALGPTGR